MHDSSDQHVLHGLDISHARICAEQRNLFAFIAEADRRDLWHSDGARDMAHWLWMRYGVSDWKARRWIDAARALEALPLLSQAFASGGIGIDKVVELTRFATPETESALISWAQEVSCGAIRRRGDLHAQSLRAALDAERSRSLSWWYFDEGRRFGLEAELPASQGAVVARALERLAESLPTTPEEDDLSSDARRADALVALASARIASDPDPDRATVVIHASLEALTSGQGGGEVEGGGVVHAETVRRLGCSARLQMMLEDEKGQPIKLGRLSREPSSGMMRALRYRDRECRFPGCAARRFTHAHHITWWERGGKTDLDNLLLVCSFHHRLVHEHGWGVRRRADGSASWFRPDGTRHRAGPGPPAEAASSA